MSNSAHSRRIKCATAAQKTLGFALTPPIHKELRARPEALARPGLPVFGGLGTGADDLIVQSSVKVPATERPIPTKRGLPVFPREPAGDDDTDRDGLTDAFEEWHFGDTAVSTGGPSEDQDGDGFIDAHEDIAGTDPTNSHSFFRMSGIKSMGNEVEVVLQWPSANGRSYALYGTAQMSNAWDLVEPRIVATPVLNVRTTSFAGGTQFFRLEVEKASPF